MENNKNKEETKDIDLYERIVDRAHKEVENVRSVYIWLAGALGIIIATGITVATFLTWNTIRDMKYSMISEVDILQRQVKGRIDEEFKKEKIQSLIEDKAHEYTEGAVQQYVSAEVNEVITPFKKEMQNTSEEAKTQIERLNNLFYVTFTSDEAKTGSKKAYIELKKYAAKDKIEGDIIAHNNLIVIERNLRFMYEHTTPNPIIEVYIKSSSSGEKMDLHKVPLDLIVDMMISNEMDDDSRHGYMQYIVKRPKEDVFKEALRVFESDSLPTCAAFCGILSEISEEKADFLDFDAWTEICKKQVNKK
jgi:hypothetical protein